MFEELQTGRSGARAWEEEQQAMRAEELPEARSRQPKSGLANFSSKYSGQPGRTLR